MTFPVLRVRPSVGTRGASSPAEPDTVHPVAELLLRSVLVGLGIGAIVVSDRNDGTVGIVIAGILAIGAALVELGS